MTPTTDPSDISYALSVIRLYPSAFSGVSPAELKAGFLFVDRANEVVMHVKPERRSKVYGVPLGTNAMQITHLASSKKGQAKEFIERLFLWGKCDFYLFVKTDNHRAISFYERHQFRKATIVKFKTFSSYIMVRRYQ